VTPPSEPSGLSEGEPLAPRLTLGTGGPARFFVSADSEASLCSALAWAKARQVETFVLGGGSNVVCADPGFDGLVIETAWRGITQARQGQRVYVTAAAGEAWDGLVEYAVEHDLAGIECLSGIPGRVGATPIQNVGAYGQEVRDTIIQVRCLDRETLRVTDFDNPACDFAYRDSRFKSRDHDRFVVLAVTFALTPGGPLNLRYGDLAGRVNPESANLRSVRQAVLAARREKSMLLSNDDPNRRSCGSFFLNPLLSAAQFAALQKACVGSSVPHYAQPNGHVKLPAAWLIEAAGYHKGQRVGNVGLSSKHALAVVAHEGATSTEVRAFAAAIKASVLLRFNIELHAEPRFLGFSAP
jgi:UDP-N-acetylmuramate dehydrogenase